MIPESLLADVFIFSSLGQAERRRVARLCAQREIAEGEIIFQQNDPPRWFLVLLKGAVRIYKTTESGRTVILRIVHAGDVFGEIATFSGSVYSASAQALTASRILLIGHDEFMEIFRAHPQVGFEITLDLCRRLREAHQTIHAMAVDPVERRLVGILVHLADRIGRNNGHEIEIPIRVTRKHFAEMTGVRVETMIRTMGVLKNKGLVATRKERLVVRDIAGLRSLIEDDRLVGNL